MSIFTSLYNIKKPGKALSLAYILAFSIIALFTIAGHGTTYYIMKKQAESTEVTYHLSRIRGLVQRIPYHVENYRQHLSEVDRMLLVQAEKEARSSHSFLVDKINKQGTISHRLTEIYFRSRFEINENMISFLDKISRCSMEDRKYGEPRDVCGGVKESLNAGLLTSLTSGFDVALEGYREETVRKIDGYHRMQVIGTLIILIVLFVEAILIFRPLIRKIEGYHKLLLKQALEDPLTKLRNRRAFVQSANGELRQASREQTSIAMVLMDLDKFKSVNDTYGHDVGDTVLKHFSKMLRKHLRKGDIIGRIGGEEFAVILRRTTDKDLAFQILDRMRALVADTPCPYNDKNGKLCSLHYSVSIGAIAFVPGEETVEELLMKADELLYRAKEEGRNRVIIAD